MNTTRQAQRGSAMLITMILIAAILAGAAVLVSLQLGANRSTDLTRTGISALYCAEAGLTATRTTVAANQSDWGTWLGDGAACTTTACWQGAEPSWLATVDHDLDDPPDGADFVVTLEDNFDEVGTDVPGTDADGKVFVVSRCIKYPDTPREVRELVSFQQASNCYASQRGGCGGNGNMNGQ